MQLAAQNSPNKIQLSAEEIKELYERLAASNLSEEDKKAVSGLVDFTLWLSKQLQMAKISISRLKKIFGISTEKKSLQ